MPQEITLQRSIESPRRMSRVIGASIHLDEPHVETPARAVKSCPTCDPAGINSRIIRYYSTEHTAEGEWVESGGIGRRAGTRDRQTQPPTLPGRHRNRHSFRRIEYDILDSCLLLLL
jgi:hypothetical protein